MSMPPIAFIDEPLLARVHRLASPAYRVTPPAIHAPARSRPTTPDALQAVWNRGMMGVRAVDVYRLRDVYVCGEGLVFDAQGQVYRTTIGQHSAAQIAMAAQMVNRARRARAQVGFAGAVVLCKKASGRGFSDWLLDMLPRAVLARTQLQPALQLAGLRYIISGQAGFLRAAMFDALALAGIHPADIIEADAAPRFFEDLILIDGISDPGQYLSPLAISCLEQWIERIPTGQAAQLYLTRRNAASRRLVNEAALIRIAEREGYVVVDPTQTPLVQRIGMFKGARRIAGVVGAGMIHAMFMPRGGQVRLFMPGGMADPLHWFVSQIRGHDYAEQRCAELPADRGEDASRGEADITISPTAFRRFIQLP